MRWRISSHTALADRYRPEADIALLSFDGFRAYADTTAAVAGQIAGAHYGKSGIPSRWMATLHKREEIEELAKHMYAGGKVNKRNGA